MRHSLRMIIGLVWSGICCLLCLFAQPDFTDACPDEKTWREVKGWLVEAESRRLSVAASDGIPAAGTRLTHRIIAATSDSRLTYFVGHPDAALGIDWSNEPFSVDIKVQGERLVKHYRFNRMVTYAPLPHGSAVPDPIRSDVIFFFMPIWPLQQYPAPQSNSSEMIFVVSEAIDSVRYVETSKRQIVGGEPCRLLCSKNGDDRIWISEKKDLCVFRREWYVYSDKTMVGELQTKEVREVAHGLWFPVDVVLTYFAVNLSDSSRQPVARTRTRILHIEVDDGVPSNVHDVTLRPGTIELTSENEIKQLSAGGNEHLTSIVSFYRDRLDLPHRLPTLRVLKEMIAQAAVGAAGGYLLGIAVLAAVQTCR